MLGATAASTGPRWLGSVRLMHVPGSRAGRDPLQKPTMKKKTRLDLRRELFFLLFSSIDWVRVSRDTAPPVDRVHVTRSKKAAATA